MHQDTYNGRKMVSVTQAIGIIDKRYLVDWAGKLGIKKALALRDYYLDAIDKEVSKIPDSWFKDNNIQRKDFWKDHNQIRDESTDLGDRFHEDVENWLLKKNEPIKSNAAMVERFIEAAKQHSIVPAEIEKQVISENYGYQGTMDFAGYFDDALVVADWKSSNRIDGVAYPTQLAAYAMAYNEEKGTNIKEGIIVRVPKPNEEGRVGKAQIKRYQLAEYFPTFLKCLALYKDVRKAG